MRLPLALVLLVSLAPAAAACNGLSPGDRIVTDGSSCTLAFLVANKDGLYFATAGHCVSDGATVSNPDHGDIGVAVYRYLDPDEGQPTDGAPGHDFALVRVKPELYAKLNPALCEWGGPTGIVEDASADGGGVRHYGHGTLVGETEPTRKREGFNVVNEDNFAFYWAGAGVPGDSGSAVIAQDGRALGVLTHLLVRPPDTNGGTHLLRGFALAEEAGFAPLRLVLEGEDPVAVLAQMQRAPPPPTAPGEPTPGTPATPTGSPTPTSNGTAPPPAANGTNPEGGEDNLTEGAVEGATADGGNETPAAPLALVLVALAGAAARRRRQ